MGKLVDLTNQTFTYLTVLERYGSTKHKKATWLCRCKCGKDIVVIGSSLTSGKTKSCGCYHSEQVSKYNHIYKKKYNTYDLSGEYGIGYTEDGYEFYFDLEDYEKIKDYCWRVEGEDGYISAWTSNNSSIKQHRLIMGVTDKDIKVDHIRHKTNDNRKSELRLVSNQNNSMNHQLFSNNTSGVTGVYYNKKLNKWCSFIIYDYQQIHLGVFEKFEDAVKARKDAEDKYFKEYSYDNSMKLFKDKELEE